MKINWKVRFKNKTWLLTFIAAVLTLVYRALNVAGITPHIAQEQLVELATMLVGILVLLGVVIDPTTKGVLTLTRLCPIHSLRTTRIRRKFDP